ncbi:AMP-binding protein [Solirubrobacter ginsenosidimutans]|uniref:AMP-binding protein n=1 Tax=Solirubrobacter ginsenosidimutans TaxID=490573 RepID=A0A9X3S475_9ACTN|nr:AMP-binding protein [Solirubrobacter ginsenosidimutans]MDA0162841.1 AMP-binding protein [Solirubrobacter ginsenosidimutans]
MNFWRDVVQNAPPHARALVELARDGSRREYTFGALSGAAGRLAGTLDALGVRRGDVVLTLVGNRPEWALTMLACFRQGFVVLPCTEQLRPKDLAQRLAVAQPRIVVADVRNSATLKDAGWSGETLWVPWEAEASHTPPHAELAPEDPCLITFTSGTSGEPKAVLHGQRYLTGQHLQAEHWLAPHAGELVWCTAAAGWSKSARNAFIAPWLRGAAALLHDARFDPRERLELIARERVDVLCMAPTEYRVIAKRATLAPLPSLKGVVAAGEALNPEVLHAWHEAIGLWIRDGYGQTETGQLTGAPLGETPRPGSMGRPLPGVELDIVDGELVLQPRSDPTFFLRYLGDAPHEGPWHTGDRVVRDDDGYLHFEGRTDDVIISAGYRIGPFEVESALVAHEAVAEAAVVAAPDDERGSIVRAVVVLRDGYEPSDTLARALQDHVKGQTAPYKYPRVVDFVADLPKTSSGKVRRALLRGL